MNSLDFTKLKPEEIVAIMQLTYQLIACAKQAPISEDDDDSIETMMHMMGFKTIAGNIYWDIAVDFNPFEAFEIVSNFTTQTKEAFKSLILSVAAIDNVILRNDIAHQLFTKFKIMSLITHFFKQQQRIENGRIVADDLVQRLASFNYDITGNNVEISITPVLSPKRARLVRQIGFTLYYQGLDPDYCFELECWPDNGTIKRLSVFRDDIGVEYRYISDHQD